jgi:hypothetical protein
MYNNFLSEKMAESFRGGRVVKADINNAVTKERKRVESLLNETHKRTGRAKHLIALDFVKSNEGDVKKYIVSQGETPHENVAEMATQAFLLRQKEIDTVARTMDVPHTDAEVFLEESEAKAQEISHPDADNFLGGIMAGVGQVASVGLGKLADAHQKKTGKRGVAGFFADVLGGLAGGGEKADNSGNDKGNAATNYSLGMLAKEIEDKVVDNKKKQVISQNLPLIIAGVVALILITILITRHATKR